MIAARPNPASSSTVPTTTNDTAEIVCSTASSLRRPVQRIRLACIPKYPAVTT